MAATSRNGAGALRENDGLEPCGEADEGGGYALYQASKVPVAVEPQQASATGMEMGEGNGVFWDEGIGGTFWDDMMWETFPDSLDLELSGLVDFEAYGDAEALGWDGGGGAG